MYTDQTQSGLVQLMALLDDIAFVDAESTGWTVLNGEVLGMGYTHKGRARDGVVTYSPGQGSGLQ